MKKQMIWEIVGYMGLALCIFGQVAIGLPPEWASFTSACPFFYLFQPRVYIRKPEEFKNLANLHKKQIHFLCKLTKNFLPKTLDRSELLCYNKYIR